MPSFTPDQIVRFLVDGVGRPSRPRELARAMAIPEREYRAFRTVLKSLLADGRLVRLKRGRIAPPDPLNLAVGTIVVRRGGHMFSRVDRDDKSAVTAAQEEIFIRPRDRRTALDGDRVLVRRHAYRDGPSAEGAIVRILERANKPILGIYQRSRHFSYVVPEPSHPLREILVPQNATGGAEVGQQVMVSITEWGTSDVTPCGKITEVLGFPDDPGVDIQRIIAGYQLPRAFSRTVTAEAAAFPARLSPSALEGREDYRDILTFTIDPVDARDHDDAVSLQRVDSTWRLGVHIADVSHYVTDGSELDREAYERGTSVYLVDRVIPMLPVRLSNDLCSLRPQRDRLTMSCIMDVSDDGRILKFRFCNSVIRSSAKLAYVQVGEYFSSGKPDRAVTPMADTLDQMRSVSRTLRQRRMKEGSLDLEVPEAKVILDEEGHPTQIIYRRSDDSHQLIEEFMLAANQCAAAEFLRKTLPCLYRVHAPPSQEKMEEFAGFVETLGLRFSPKGGGISKKLSRLLEQTKDDPRRDMIHNILLRSLMKAVYQPDNIGHFGLAFPHYAHFTSPIRRYPDLWVHRHLKKIIAHSWKVSERHADAGALPVIGKQCSERERTAEEAERESVRIKQLEYLESRIGDEFTGRISGFLEFGFFVTITEAGIDGLVRFSGIDDDYYVWDRDRWCVRGRRRGRTFTLGDAVSVQLIRTDPVKREIDLVLADSQGGAPSRPGRGRFRPRQKHGPAWLTGRKTSG